MSMQLMFVHVDPCSHYTHLDPNEVMEWAGLPPQWAVEGLVETDNGAGADVEKYVLNAYQFPVTDSCALEPRTKIEEDGSYHFPGDPVLYPFVTINGKDVKVICYPYGLTAFIYGDTTHVYRLD